MSAHIVTNEYHLTGRKYYTVQCDECLVVLNSGHHYSDKGLNDAARLTFNHNAEYHVTEQVS